MSTMKIIVRAPTVIPNGMILQRVLASCEWLVVDGSVPWYPESSEMGLNDNEAGEYSD